MNIKKRLFSNMFLRNMIADLFGRSGYDKTPGAFTPYFQYKIGAYQSNYYLYFPKEPYALRYKNEFFNKLNEYNGVDTADYLEFHYAAYPDKQDFLKLLRYEIFGRLNQKISKSQSQRLQFVQAWVLEKQQEFQLAQQAALKQEIDQDVREMLPAVRHASTEEVENLAQALSKKLSDHIEKIMAGVEEGMQSLASSLVTGNIILNNQNHKLKVVKLLILLKDVKAPAQIAKTEQLFKKFSDTDIAAILRLHFVDFKSKKLNTAQVNIKQADDLIPDKSPAVKKLEEALRDFFYS